MLWPVLSPVPVYRDVWDQGARAKTHPSDVSWLEAYGVLGVTSDLCTHSTLCVVSPWNGMSEGPCYK